MDANRSNLVSILRGGSVYTIGKVVGDILVFILEFLIARFLGPTAFGVFTYSREIMGTTSTISRIGAGEGLIRKIPTVSNRTEELELVLTSVVVTTIFSALASILLLIFTEILGLIRLDSSSFTPVFRIFCLLLPIVALSDIVHKIFLAKEKNKYEVIISKILNPVLNFISAITAIILGLQLIDYTILFFISETILLGISVYAYGRLYGVDLVILSLKKITNFIQFCIPFAISKTSTILYTRADIFLVGIILTPEAVGIYRIIILLSGIIVLPLDAINQLFPPIASRLHKEDSEQLSDIFEFVTRWAFSFSAIGGIWLWTAHKTILDTVGNSYTGQSDLFLVLLISYLFQASVGPSGYLLRMSGHQTVESILNWLFGITNVVLTYVLLSRFGLLGAAIGTAITLSALNLIRAILIFVYEGYYPYSKRYLIMLVPICVSSAIMILMEIFTTGILWAIARGAIGLSVFLIISFFFISNSEEQKILMYSLK